MFLWYNDLKLKNKLLVGNGVAILLLLIFAFLVYSSMSRLVETNKLVTHTERVIASGHELMEEALSLETGERGYLITGKKEFLEPYYKSLVTFTTKLAETKNQVADNPEQVKRLVVIDTLMSRWNREAGEKAIAMREEVSKRGADLEDLQDLVGKAKGKKILDRIRRELNFLDNTFAWAKDLNGSLLVLSIAKDMADQESGKRGFLITGKEEFLDTYHSGQSELKEHFSRLYSIIDSAGVGSDYNDVRETVALIEKLCDKWRKESAEPELAIRREINTYPVTLKDINSFIEAKTGKKIMDELTRAIEKFIRVEEGLMVTRRIESDNSANESILTVLSGTLIAILVILLTGALIARSISERLFKFIEVTKAIEEGDLSRELDIKTKDEIGALALTFMNMTTSLKSSQKKLGEQNWLKSNLADISGKARSATSLKDAADQLVSDLTPILGAPCGVIYIANEENGETRLELLGEYGLSFESGSEQSFRVGEGLVGECALQRVPILIDSVPGDHVTVNSGTGSSEPLNLLLCPILFEDKLLGVFEVASFRKFTYIEKSLVEQLSAQAGVVISSIRFTQEVRRLLGESEEFRKELEKKATELSEASAYKSEFLAAMSHEIRTPMNAIIGMADLLEETELTEEQGKYIRTYRHASESLLSIINDILDLSKIEAGWMELEKTAFNCHEVLEDVGEMMGYGAEERGLELAVFIDPKTPEMLIGDQMRLSQVITNLASNAIKFTEHGEVLISMEPVEIKEDKATIRFSVKDTGIGISEHKLETIFESFTQADTSTTRKYGGTGLGLSISRKLVEIMGGGFSVESEEGVGSLFSFTATFLRDETCVKEEEGAGVDLTGVRVLIVDDNATNRLIFRKTVEGWGCHSNEVEDGVACVKELERCVAQGESYDVILLDVHMPEMDGIEVAKKIQGMEGSRPPVIVISSSGGQARRQADLANLGIYAYTSKPVRRSELLHLIQSSLAGKKIVYRPAIKKIQTVTGKTAPMKILVAEDNKSNQNVVLAFLRKTGHEVVIVENGKEALDKVTGDEQFDIVLMDIEMPEMDGLTATEKIRQWEERGKVERTPIVALTAHALQEHEKRSKAAGCDAHISKPIKKSLLLATIDRYQKERRTRA